MNKKILNFRTETNRPFRLLASYLTFAYILLIYSFLYTCSAMAYCYGWRAILFAFSIMAVMMFCFSLILAIISWGIEAVLNLLALRRINMIISTLTNTIILFLTFWIVIRYLYLLIQCLPFSDVILDSYRTSGFIDKNIFRLTVFVIMFALIAIFRKKILQKFEESIGVFIYCDISLFLVSVAIVITMPFSIEPIDWHKNNYHRHDIVPGDIKKHNIILLTCESLGAHDMSLYGYGRNTTPNIDNLALESYVFNNMHASSSDTAGCLPSIMEGTYPSTHKKYYTHFFVNPLYSEENLVDILRSTGYETYAASIPYIKRYGYETSFQHIDPPLDRPDIFERISSRYNIPLYAWLMRIIEEDILRPFEIVRYFCKTCGLRPKLKTDNDGSQEDILSRAKQLIINADAPYFIWIYMSHSPPYLPPKSYRGRFLKEDVYTSFQEIIKFHEFYPLSEQGEVDKIRARYDEKILFLDHHLGRFVQFLKDNDIFDDSILIISSDHGQSFSKGYLGHSGVFLYEEVTRIPFIVHMPNQRHGKRIDSMAAQVDISPTILELCGIKKPVYMTGESLVRYMKNPNLLSDKPKFSMALRIIRNQIRGGTVAIYKDRYKLIYNLDKRKVELYDLIVDPDEELNISNEKKEVTARLKKLILRNIRRP